jgi:hypothetical protein
VVAVVLLVVFLVLPMLHAATEKRSELLDTNAKLEVSQSAETLKPGGRACVRRLDVELPRVDVRVYPGFAAARPPELRLTVQDRGGAVLAEGRATSYANGLPLLVPVDVGRPRRDATVCLRNVGGDPVTLAHAELPQEGRRRLPVRVDVTTRTFTTVERFPVALTRASFFKSDIVSRPLIALLALVVLALAAAAIVLVLRARRDEDAGA